VDNLKSAGISVGVVDLFRLKPINEKLMLETMANYKRIVTYEEDFLIGGLGSAIAEIMVDNGVFKSVLRIGQSDRFVYDLGGRDVIWEKHGLDELSAENKIIKWLNKPIM
jgi:transketolase